MTIEIEAGASQTQCSMKSSRRPSFFYGVFLIDFVLNDTSTRAVAQGPTLENASAGWQLILKPIRRSTGLTYQRASIWNRSTTALLGSGMSLTLERIEALAPDQASLAAARKLLQPSSGRRWEKPRPSLG